MRLKLGVITSLVFLTVATFAAPSTAEQVCVRTNNGQRVCGERVDAKNFSNRSASITLFKSTGSAGRHITIYNNQPDLSQLGFKDKASSIIVHFGIWQVCTGVSYRGQCVKLPPGYYGNLGSQGIKNSISSVRLIH